MQDRPSTVLDPVCGMAVDVARAEAADLTAAHEGRIYSFCRSGCRRAFLEEPDVYAEKAAAEMAGGLAAAAVTPTSGGRTLPAIDAGMRRWYESCSCCLGDAYPEIKAALDAERAAATSAPAPPGICEVAEAG